MTYVAHARTATAQALAALTLCLLTLILAAVPASAEGGLLKRGDTAVTGFSGARAEAKIPDDVHPLDRTFIDLDGATVKIFGLSDLGTAPRGQVSDVPALREIKARDTGQVFGITLVPRGDAQSPDIYVTATSLFGLQLIAPDGKGGVNRLLQGATGAQWMPGQFGKDGTPGSIYRIDGVTGAVSLFANVRTGDRDNAGPGLGNIAYDSRTKQLFVSDLETGLIHRITLDGKDRDVFDHGETGRKAQGLDAVTYDPARRMNIESPSFDSEDTATWGFADERRRVFGLGVSKGRLFYAVAEGAAVWSVSIDEEGDFGNDPRIELEVPNTPPGTNITSMTFDGAGMMYLAQRGAPTGSYDYTAFANAQAAVLVRFRWDEKEGRWSKVPEEYAVGLGGEYRSTLGGVALNYGYDKFGRIDYGKCRQTVWTTGEHLREGEDLVRVASGGAKTVHGLQGMYKSRVRPQNEPPYESWFTDYNGIEDDPATYGQVGALAIYAPCDPAPQSAPLVTPEVIGLDPPIDDSGLVIDKRCFAGAPGAKIRCRIEVHNVMDHVPSDDVTLIDLTHILIGPGAGSPVPVVAVDIPFPSIFCAAAPTPDFYCKIPAALLLPGDTIGIDVWVDTHDLTLGGNTGFRNCAKIKHPDGYAKACAEGGTDIVVEKIGPGTCDAGAACKFGLRIANIGTMPFNGDVLLADAMFIGGGVPNVPVTSVNPPIACSAGDTAQLPFTCQTHLSLMPGEDHIHWVEVTMPAPPGYEAENCFGALDPALILAGPVPPGLIEAGTGNPSCVTVVVPAPMPIQQQQQQMKKDEPPVTLIKLPRCDDGRARRADGSCPCPQGTRWNDDKERCAPVRPRCSDPDRRKDDGSCCPYGTYFDNEDGRCRAPDPGCRDPERRRDDGSCCPRGTVVSDNGERCVGIETACPFGTRWNYGLETCLPLRPLCGFGERYDWRSQRCRGIDDSCPRGTHFNRHTRECEEGGQSCPEGTHWNRIRHTCEKDDQHATCPDGSPRLANGGCRCPLNKRWNEAMGACDGGSHPTRCVPGEQWINGRCVKTGGNPSDTSCPQGQHRIGKVCVPDRDPGNETCPSGQHRMGKFCLPDQNPGHENCPAGQHRIGKVCVPDRNPDAENCPAGRHRLGKVCVPDRIDVPKGPAPVVCLEGQIKVGNRCITKRIDKTPPVKIPDTIRRQPKNDPPKVHIEPRQPKIHVPKVTPRIEIPKKSNNQKAPEIKLQRKPEIKLDKKPEFKMQHKPNFNLR